MSTLVALIEQGKLIKLDVHLEYDELEQRQILLLPRAAEGLQEKLEKMESEWQIELSPIEQFDELTHRFVTGATLDYPRQFNILRRTSREGVWELKSGDIRMFGWFPVKDSFICCDVANANVVKAGRQYASYCEQVWFYRDQLDLDDPKFLTGEEPEDVVSNCYTS